MKEKRRRFFSITRKENEFLKSKQDYIDLVVCPHDGGKSCSKHRKLINENMKASKQHLLNKDYHQSIEELKTAFYSTADLTKLPCRKCATFYRKTIVNTLELMHDDLKRMSSGIFSKNKNRPYFLLAAETLEELKQFDG